MSPSLSSFFNCSSKLERESREGKRKRERERIIFELLVHFQTHSIDSCFSVPIFSASLVANGDREAGERCEGVRVGRW